MTDRDELLKIVRQEFPPNVEATDGLLYWPALEERGHGRVRVPRINNKQTFSGQSGKIMCTRWCSKETLNVMIGVQRWTYLNVSPRSDMEVVLILRTKASTI